MVIEAIAWDSSLHGRDEDQQQISPPQERLQIKWHDQPMHNTAVKRSATEIAGDSISPEDSPTQTPRRKAKRVKRWVMEQWPPHWVTEYHEFIENPEDFGKRRALWDRWTPQQRKQVWYKVSANVRHQMDQWDKETEASSAAMSPPPTSAESSQANTNNNNTANEDKKERRSHKWTEGARIGCKEPRPRSTDPLQELGAWSEKQTSRGVSQVAQHPGNTARACRGVRKGELPRPQNLVRPHREATRWLRTRKV